MIQFIFIQSHINQQHNNIKHLYTEIYTLYVCCGIIRIVGIDH